MNEQIIFQEVMKKKYQELFERNPKFSVRAFARRIGMQPAATNEILKGSRRVSKKLAEKIAERLKLSPTEKHDLVKLFPETKNNTRSKKVSTHQPQMTLSNELGEAEIKLTLNWVHFALLSLIKTTQFKSDVTWIADKFSVTEKQVKGAIENLIQSKLITRDENGNLSRTFERIHTSDNVPCETLKKAHLSDMKLAVDKLVSVDVTLRDYSSMVFRGNPQQIEKAKLILRKAQDEIEEIMDQGDAQEVYKVCTYLFPLTVEEKR
jgi:uncharacterized protein (TIGR02147 family)